MEVMSKEYSTDEVLTMLRQTDAGRGLARLAIKEIERLVERTTELEGELAEANSAADFYQNEADHYYGVSEANE